MNQVYENIYQINVPLPNNPLKELHAYLVKGNERNLLIDTGFNHKDCKNAMLSAFKELEVSIDNTDIFITHLHADHSGLVCSLMSESNHVYMSDKDGILMNSFLTGEFWDRMKNNNIMTGTPVDKQLDYNNHPAFVYKHDYKVDYMPVRESDVLKVGKYEFEVIDLAGHTPGQIGLYERNHKIMFCGDHILNKITPNIIFWNFDMDAIGVFMDNLRKVKTMDVGHLFSSHRVNVENHVERVNQLLDHHDRRLNEVTEILGLTEKNAYDVSRKMTWDFGKGDFDNFPPQQKWFAVSEAFSHLEHLYKKGVLERKEIEGTLYYSNCNKFFA